MVDNTRPPRALGALALTALLAAPALAQTTPSTAQPTRPAQNTTATSAGVSDAIFQKLRPATFRLDQRAASDNSPPDGIGTGWFINDSGLALTAYHVIFGADKLSARFLNGERYDVEVVGYDDSNDVALVQVKVNRKVPFIPLAQAAPKVGEAALAIGNSGGQLLKEKRGVLKRLDVAAGRADFPSGTLELDAPLAPGDSGGPVINARGEGIGVVSYIRAAQGSTPRQLVWNSYAVPMTSGSSLLASLQAGRKNDAPAIGIGYSLPGELPDEYFSFGLGGKPGVLFTSVVKDGPAARAGLRPLQVLDGDSTPPRLAGDVIVAVNGKTVREWLDLIEQIRAYKVGDTVRLTVQRGAQSVEVPVELGARAQVNGGTR